ncbi:alpha/beta fold hydrolase [Bacillus sp. ISL-40]|uniref:alpha/beta fold hydrolase n=1 Tax=unclassified Bacillus (in: firmicutes) TaxID=185979 RepID=UPI001BE5A97A|nr:MULTISPECIES: alpha/beta hydrolase [unclassified Bacillus (in: firmicutes)]MBT2700091.1 alpha/beta fold hydrolase [Bacillus sp. ISL-40]MBT2720590.1 alpha/beta fold hydrolase [Bacillus sp. ISL-46]MBT2741253.1 alpha/beta fold hydrolase [Bacillus sp. ISL-77]
MANITQQLVKTDNFETFVNRSGEGNSETILFLHGSGPGVFAWANWRYALNACGETYDCIAPDLLGFGQSGHPESTPKNRQGWMDLWVNQLIELLDRYGIQKAHVVGNSLGCSIALELLLEYPERFGRVVLMGPGGTPNTKLSPELARAKGFYDNPSEKKMRQIMGWFVYDVEKLAPEIDSLAATRYVTAMRPEIHLSNESIFATAAVPVPVTALKRIQNPILLVHGRDDMVCSVESSYYLLSHLQNVQLHVYGKCGHWTQIENQESFNNLIQNYFSSTI